MILELYKGYIKVMLGLSLGLHWGNIRVILGMMGKKMETTL